MILGLRNYFIAVWEYLKNSPKKINLFDEDKARDYGKNPFYMLGSMTYLYWMITIISGVLLIAWYIPTPDQAFSSILHIQESIPFGWLIRGLHKYGADAVIVCATLRIFRMYFLAEYKRDGFYTFLVAILILVIGMYSGLTGYLLIWNQRAFWATKVFATFPTYLDQLPIMGLTNFGKNISHILLGGASIGAATMTRFYGFHYMLSIMVLIFVELYFWSRGGKRMNLTWQQVTLFTGFLVLISFSLPAELGSRSDPVVTPNPILSDWYFLALYQIMKYMAPLTATLWTPGVAVVALLIPFLDLNKETAWNKRWFWNWIGIMALALWILFSILIIMGVADIKRDPPYWYNAMFWTCYFAALAQWAHFGMRARLWVYGLTLASYGIFYGVICILTGPRPHWIWHPSLIGLLIVMGLTEFYWKLREKKQNQSIPASGASPA